MHRSHPSTVARASGGRRRAPRPRTLPGFLLVVLLVGMLGIGSAILAVVSVGATVVADAYHVYAEELPTINRVTERDVFKTTRILDRDGNLLYELFNQDEGKRTIVRIGEMPKMVKDAILAVEDATFYDNPGIEVRGITRAAVQWAQQGQVVSGGSTITQQLIKNVLLEPEERTEESLNRKIKEAVLALELSRTYSKDQILEWYVNEVNFGNLSYGIGTAARTYFNKTVQELTLPEAALLAGLPQRPALYDPFRNFEAAKGRQETVLDLMASHGLISEEEAERAKAETVQLVPPETANTTTIKYPHWVYYVRSVLEERYGARRLLNAGWTVTTSIDPRLQDIAEDVVRRNVASLRSQGATNAALVAINPWEGEVLAMVGSPDFYDASIDGQVNAAVVERQPGSSIKPIVYLNAFQKGFGPATVVQDAPLALPDGPGRTWRPQNFDNRFRGAVPLRSALGNSLNIPAVKVLQFAGLEDTVNFAKRLGLTSLRDANQYGLSFALGGAEVRLIELATAYTVLANNGIQTPVSPILRIEDGDGHIVFEHKPNRQQIVDPRAAWLVNDILSDNNARSGTFGLNSPLRLPNNRIAAAKTGTTDLNRDSWTMGYTPSLVAGVWVGRADNRPMSVRSDLGPGRIWNQFMVRALEGWPNEPFESPPGLLKDTICVASSEPGSSECGRAATDWFMEEWAPSTWARVARRAVAVDRATGRLADRDTPYEDVLFQRFRARGAGEGPFAPTEYSGRAGVNRPWEVLPPTILPTLAPPTYTPTFAPGETRTPVPTLTPTITPSPTITPTPEPTRTPRPTLTPRPSPTETPEVPNPWAGYPAVANILSPRAGQNLTGPVAVQGSASNPEFVYYRMEYLRSAGPNEWDLVRDAVGITPVVNGQLDDWDMVGAPNGTYWIRLTVALRVGPPVQSSVVVNLLRVGG